MIEYRPEKFTAHRLKGSRTRRWKSRMVLSFLGASLLSSSCAGISPPDPPERSDQTAALNSISADVTGLNASFSDEQGLFAETCLTVLITAVNAEGQPVALAESQSLSISSSLGEFFAESNCQTPIDSVTIPKQASEVTLSFRSEWPGVVEYAVDETPPKGWQAGVGSITLLPSASSLVLTPPDPPPSASDCAPVRIGLVNRTGNPSRLLEDLPLTIEAATSEKIRIRDIRFFNDANCSSEAVNPVIPSGSEELTVYFNSRYVGEVLLVATTEIEGVRVGGFQTTHVQNPLNGQWITECTLAAEEPTRLSLQVQDDRFTYEREVFDNCDINKKPTSVVRLSGSLLLYDPSTSSPGATRAVDFTFEESCIEPKSESAALEFNATERCGVSDWEPGVCKVTTGLTLCEPGESVRANGDVGRDRFAIESESGELPQLTFTTDNLFPGSSLNNPNLRLLNTDGVPFFKTP